MTGPIIHRDISQGTDEWHAIRAGKWSASKAATIMGGLETKGLADLVKDVAWERVYGPISGGFKSAAMERGNELEPEARDWYAFDKCVAVEQVGFVEHCSIPNVGWSPDGLVDQAGGIEAKSPLHRAWMEVNRTRKIPAEYRWQSRWAMWVGELEWLDFVVYHPAAGGIVIPATVTESEKQQMAERICLLESRVSEEVSLLSERQAA
ncbi:YqaJ viral recombinase family protein [Pseudoxanthomonas sp.]|uniref:YqaJ viral recombinase family protein n=1 Tax=Pseudoxanthomonas sp. TaxID=1871049 RepID=UPI0026288B5C|nr:YqaJ viral recombinase family protein [Pseudoxanthomonas sp.]WDS36197.1 MAG: YqaJ viral recombinase family protein [Pseudoxanthomonas sp.]